MEIFFLAKRLKEIKSLRIELWEMPPSVGSETKRWEHTFTSWGQDYEQRFAKIGQLVDGLVSKHAVAFFGTNSVSKSTISNLFDAEIEMDFDFVSSGDENSKINITLTTPDTLYKSDALANSSDLTWVSEDVISFSHKAEVTAGSAKLTASLELYLFSKTPDEYLRFFIECIAKPGGDPDRSEVRTLLEDQDHNVYGVYLRTFAGQATVETAWEIRFIKS